jgi:hypothetical protein
MNEWIVKWKVFCGFDGLYETNKFQVDLEIETLNSSRILFIMYRTFQSNLNKNLMCQTT